MKINIKRHQICIFEGLKTTLSVIWFIKNYFNNELIIKSIKIVFFITVCQAKELLDYLPNMACYLPWASMDSLLLICVFECSHNRWWMHNSPWMPTVHRCGLHREFVAAAAAAASSSSLETIILDQDTHLKLFSTCRGSSAPLICLLRGVLHLNNYSSSSDSLLCQSELKLLCMEARWGLSPTPTSSYQTQQEQQQQHISHRLMTSLSDKQQTRLTCCYIEMCSGHSLLDKVPSSSWTRENTFINSK